MSPSVGLNNPRDFTSAQIGSGSIEQPVQQALDDGAA